MILKRIYVLEKTDKMGITRLKSQETIIDLIRHSVANRIFQHTTQKENLIHCAQLINKVKVRKLEISHSYPDIQQLINMVEDDFNQD